MNDDRCRDKTARPGEPRSDIITDHELLRRAGIDIDRFLALPDFAQRLTLKLAERLVDAGRRADPDAIMPDSRNAP